MSLKPITDYVNALVHASARADALITARHRAFIAPRLIGSVIGLAAFPLYVAARGVPGTIEVVCFAWLLVPLALAFYLSRTGRYESAHVISSFALTALIAAVAAHTGGIASFAAIWLVVVPLDAALSASRRVVAVSSIFTLSAAAGLFIAGTNGALPPTVEVDPMVFAALGIVSAVMYATALALGSESLTRTGVWLLYAEEERYRLLARNMTDVITRHGPNGAVLFASQAAESLFGAKLADLRGHALFDRVHVADRPAYLTALADAAALDEPRSVEFRVRRDEATEKGDVARFIWVEMRCRRLQSANGEAASLEVVAVMRDVTERKEQEEALTRARAEADDANAAKVKFLANMSHELRTPLNAIIGFSDMLIQEERMRLDQARRKEYAGLINDSGNHLLSVVNGILDMSKLETGDFEIAPEPFAPTPVMDSCCDLLSLKARDSGVELNKRISPMMPEIIADKRALKQILLNVLSNAIKFTDRGGRVTMIAAVDGPDLLIEVEDSGTGISAEDLPRVGRPFFQVKGAYNRRHDGTGLGLSIVHGLVALHGGEVGITSRVGEGTRVSIRLPLNCETAKPVARKDSKTDGNVAHPSFQRVIQAADSIVKKTA